MPRSRSGLLRQQVSFSHFRRSMLSITAMAAVSLFVTTSSFAQKEDQTESTRERIEESHIAATQEWFEQWMNPAGEENIQDKLQAGYEQFRNMDNRPALKAMSSSAWQQVGGSQEGAVSGRPTGIAFHPTNPDVIYLTTSLGGLWKTENGGTTWVNLSDSWSTLSAGGVAVDPHNPDIVYCGTGDIYGGYTAYPSNGVGLYRSMDGGANWKVIAPSSAIGAAVHQLFVSPDSSNLVYATTARGVLLSTDSGSTWKVVSGGSGVTCMIIDPSNASTMYASVNGVVRKSTDYGRTWAQVYSYGSGGLSMISMSPKDVNKIYVSIWTGSSSVLARSTDAGGTWSVMSTSNNYMGKQGQYANAVAVSPKNADVVIVGGLDIHRSSNGGKSFGKLTDWTSYTNATNFAHADVHYLVYNGTTLYTMTDGGIYRSTTDGSSWSQEMNKTLATLQFIGGDAAPDLSYFAAGAQDNGVNAAKLGESSFQSVHGGDGGSTYISQTDGEVIYSTYINTYPDGPILYRSNDRGKGWLSGPAGGGDLLGSSAIKNDMPGQAYFIYDVCESNPDVVAVCGGSKLYLTQNGGGDNFPALTTPFTRPVAVHLAKADPNYIYVGSGSSLYFSQDMGESWTKSTTATGQVTNITTDLNDPTHVYITVAGTSSAHFLVSVDGGQTFTKPAKGLPALNYKRIAVAPDGQIFIASDYGVLRSQDQGVTWYPLSQGFPATTVTSLSVRGTGGSHLVAATYGRGMFMLDLTQLPPAGTSGVSSAPSSSGPTPAITSIYPNPMTISGTAPTVHFTLPSEGRAQLSIYDVLGHEEKVVSNQWRSAGEFDVKLDLSTLTAGRHFVVLTSNGHSVTHAITVE